MNTNTNSEDQRTDVILIGAGIMSATLGAMLKEIQPDISIQIFERLDVAATESSDAWNNAGTGHSAFCELNYTPELEDGSIDCSKAIKIAESFDVSRQFWSFLVKSNYVKKPETFIRSIPHMSFVWGDENVNYLRKRFEALTKFNLFKRMQYSEDFEQLSKWMPLVMEGRDPLEKVAATRMELGTDVNFGNLTISILDKLTKIQNVELHLNHEVRHLKQMEDGSWNLIVKDLNTNKKRIVRSKFVFIGAGGGSLPLLEKADIEEGKGYGGFPVSGQWLKCKNEDIIKKHAAKVYGKASVGSPPMSVPHLDTRMINGKKELLFGPYAGFTTKFLKHGSFFDLAKSIKTDNILPMLSAGIHNIPLTKYLIDQVRQTMEDRVASLQEYFPNAKMEDWEIEIAGQRVQVIKKDPEHGGGILEFGTEIVSAADGSIAALLGASPGASTAVSIMLTLLKKCFKDQINSPEWETKIKNMIPSYGISLEENPDLYNEMLNYTSEILELSLVEESV